jgi:DHA2 family multidrug resistance protein-like MFS transporter
MTLVEGSSPLSLLVLASSFALFNMGAAPLVSLSTGLVVGSVAPEKAGSAAAVSETSAEFAFAFGIASLGSLGSAIYRGQLNASLPAEISAQVTAVGRDSLAGVFAVADSLPDPVAAVLIASARAAFTSGMHAVAGITIVVLLGVAVLALSMLRQVPPIGSSQVPVSRDTTGAKASMTRSKTMTYEMPRRSRRSWSWSTMAFTFPKRKDVDASI